jgi:hypothetical protein
LISLISESLKGSAQRRVGLLRGARDVEEEEELNVAAGERRWQPEESDLPKKAIRTE